MMPDDDAVGTVLECLILFNEAKDKILPYYIPVKVGVYSYRYR
jgi:hypothetical protein